jgi:hypothetical protein
LNSGSSISTGCPNHASQRHMPFWYQAAARRPGSPSRRTWPMAMCRRAHA